MSNKDKLLVKKVGWRLSGPEFQAIAKADEVREAAKHKHMMAKDARSLKAEIRRQKSTWRKEQAERKACQAVDLKEWTEECEHCRAAGKRQPKRPPRVRKAKTLPHFTGQLAEDKDKENESDKGQEAEDGSDSD